MSNQSSSGKLTRCVTRETSSKTLISRVLNRHVAKELHFRQPVCFFHRSPRWRWNSAKAFKRSREAREGLETFSNLPLAHVTCRNFEFDPAGSRPNFSPAPAIPDNGNRCRLLTTTCNFDDSFTNQTSMLRGFLRSVKRET